MMKYLSFHNSSLALRYFLNVKGKAIVWHTSYLELDVEVVHKSIEMPNKGFLNLKP